MSMHSLSPEELGKRLRVAREASGLKQAEVAASLDIARTTLVAIENGQRRVRINELQQLARIYDTTANSLLRNGAVHVDLMPRFRKISEASGESVKAASQLLVDLVKAEVELEDLLGIRRPVNLPAERPLSPGNVASQAERDAEELRHRLGLGLQPVVDMRTLFELEMGIRLYIRPIDSGISGLFAFDETVGACILLNANHPPERRNYSSAHELGHVVSTRREPDVLHTSTSDRSPAERYANAFARAFLTPARAVIERLRDITAGSSRLTRRHVIIMAYYFGVSREAIVRRLEELEQTKPGTWDWFQANGGITQEHVHEVLGKMQRRDDEEEWASCPTTLRVSILANEVWRRGILSEGQLSKLLNIDRLELREMLSDEEASDGAPLLLN